MRRMNKDRTGRQESKQGEQKESTEERGEGEREMKKEGDFALNLTRGKSVENSFTFCPRSTGWEPHLGLFLLQDEESVFQRRASLG
jgi:hypothetical protein